MGADGFRLKKTSRFDQLFAGEPKKTANDTSDNLHYIILLYTLPFDVNNVKGCRNHSGSTDAEWAILDLKEVDSNLGSCAATSR